MDTFEKAERRKASTKERIVRSLNYVKENGFEYAPMKSGAIQVKIELNILLISIKCSINNGYLTNRLLIEVCLGDMKETIISVDLSEDSNKTLVAEFFQEIYSSMKKDRNIGEMPKERELKQRASILIEKML